MKSAPKEACAARQGGVAVLAQALQASRQDTLATFDVFERSLPALAVPQRETLNPPLWELGHIGWFQEFWLARNPQRGAGMRANPSAARSAGVRANADALYDSSQVPHATRWALALPNAAATRADLTRQLQGTLTLLHETGEDTSQVTSQVTSEHDRALYFFRLALLHEDMHHEAWLTMAQSLGLAVTDARWQATPVSATCTPLTFDASPWQLGNGGPGFVFDNESGPHTMALPASHIDSRVLCWADYLPFVEAGGYTQPQWWGEEGAAWMAAERPVAPRYLRHKSGRESGHESGHARSESQALRHWQQWRHGQWQTLDLALPACHLTAFEAQAWCRWAGRRLPSEAEWERAAIEQPGRFEWGAVWEWTASTFLPYPGFEPHPYGDYSAPWFGSRPVLRGASFMTQPRMRHPRYRNFFNAGRNDVAAGFRSCRL